MGLGLGSGEVAHRADFGDSLIRRWLHRVAAGRLLIGRLGFGGVVVAHLGGSSAFFLQCNVTSLNRTTNHPHGLYKQHIQQTIQHITITMFIYSLSTLLRVLVASASIIPFVAAQTTAETPITIDQVYGTLVSTVSPALGYNVAGGSVFQNYVKAVNDGQFFIATGSRLVDEKPGSEPSGVTFLKWCSDLTFSDLSNSSLMLGYAARCVGMFLADNAEALSSGAQLIFQYSEGLWITTTGVSAVFVEQLNLFEGQVHENDDNWVARYWDDGRKTMPRLGWKGHDEGDTDPSAAASSFSNFGEITWMPVEEVAQLLNTSTDEFTPAKFKQVYLDTWIKTHEQAAEKNPNPEAESEIIEQVQNETDSADETTAPAAPGTAEAEDGDIDPIDDSASGRKLASVAARFVSAALRVFGI